MRLATSPTLCAEASIIAVSQVWADHTPRYYPNPVDAAEEA